MGFRRIDVLVTAMTVITWFLLVLHLFFAQRIKAFAGTVAAIGQALVEQFVDDLVVTVKSLGLVERTLVIIETQPGHALEDGVDGLGSGSLKVGILDAQDKFAAMLTGVEPGEERGACAAHMQVAGGARGETGTYFHFGHKSYRKNAYSIRATVRIVRFYDWEGSVSASSRASCRWASL